MNNTTSGLENGASLPETATRSLPKWAKTAIFLTEIVFVIGLLIWWLASKSVHQSSSLWVLFLYCFPAEFFIATVPHEPVLLYFGKIYSPMTVALISVAGTALTEILNYTVFGYVADMKVFRKMMESKSVRKTVEWFNKAPFLSLWVAGFTPIPFYPFRFLVVLARYPIAKYILAVITSRGPRMFLIALAAKAIKIPDWTILVITFVLIVAANIPVLKKLLKKRAAPAPL